MDGDNEENKSREVKHLINYKHSYEGHLFKKELMNDQPRVYGLNFKAIYNKESI